MSEHTLLRLLHIVFGAFWVGTAAFLATFLVPAFRSTAPASGPVMRELMQNRKMPLYLTIAGWTTILTGATLAWRDAGAMGFRWFERGAGLVFGIGAVLALGAMLVATLVNAPTARRMGQLMAQLQAAGRPPSDDEARQIKAMQDKLFTATRITATMLVITTALMAIARSFG